MGCCRYGDWEPILKMQPPPKTARGVTRASGYHYSRAVYHYVRVLALAAKATAADAAVMEVRGWVDGRMMLLCG
jgi:hypothetical protein